LSSCKSGSKDSLLIKLKEKKNEANTPLVYEDSVYILNENKIFHCGGYDLEVVTKVLVDSNINNPYYFMNGNRNIIEQIIRLKQHEEIFVFDVKDLESNKKSKAVQLIKFKGVEYKLPMLVINSIEYNDSIFSPCKFYLSSQSNLHSEVLYVSPKGIVDKQKNDKLLKSLKHSWTNEFEFQNWGHKVLSQKCDTVKRKI
jgi:hypothetical protein